MKKGQEELNNFCKEFCAERDICGGKCSTKEELQRVIDELDNRKDIKDYVITRELREITIHNIGNPVLFESYDIAMNKIDDNYNKAIYELKIYAQMVKLLIDDLSKFTYNNIDYYKQAKEDVDYGKGIL